MKFSTSAALAALGAVTASAKEDFTFAVLRFTNNGITSARADPLVNPGEMSTHAHQIMGGSAFGLNSTGEDLANSKCTNAMIVGDNSNYWYPKLYFHDDKDDGFEEVPVMYVNVYYRFHPTQDKIKAFPRGLGILAGDANMRDTPPRTTNIFPNEGDINPVRFTCPRTVMSTESNNPWPSNSDGKKFGAAIGMGKYGANWGEGIGFPDKNCDGDNSPLRADIDFPSCYNPKADLLDYKNNMKYPETSGPFGKYQNCPEGWIHVPQLFMEVYFQTDKFADRWTPGQGKQPFVLSNGDTTGFSYHADFMAGWDEDVLQNIIDNCNAGTKGMDQCPGVKVNTDSSCKIDSPTPDQKCTGKLKNLPGVSKLSGFAYGPAPNAPDSAAGSGSGSGSDSDSGSGSGSGSSSSPVEYKTSAAPQPPKETAVPETPNTETQAEAQPEPTEESKPEVPGKITDNLGNNYQEKPVDGAAKDPVTAPPAEGNAKTCPKGYKLSKKARKNKRDATHRNVGSNAARAARESGKARRHMQQHGVRGFTHGHRH